jgi:hypothetical protein
MVVVKAQGRSVTLTAAATTGSGDRTKSTEQANSPT